MLHEILKGDYVVKMVLRSLIQRMTCNEIIGQSSEKIGEGVLDVFVQASVHKQSIRV